MLTQDEVKELLELYKAVEAGATLQIQNCTGKWHNVMVPCQQLRLRLAKGIPARRSGPGTLRIKPKSVRLYFSSKSMIGGLRSVMDWADTHYIDIAEDGTITGGLISTMAATSHGSLSEFDRS